MHKVTRMLVAPFTAVLLIASLAGTAGAVTVTWLNMSPVPLNTTVPNNSIYNMPGIGNIKITYNMPAQYTNSRTQNACLQNGTAGATSWGAHELFAAIFTVGPDPLVPVSYTITYTLPGLFPAGSVYLGFAGLGSTTSFGGGTSTGTCSQNGSFFGDWSGGCGPWGPTQYTGAAGTFQVQNSLTGPGGQDPWWNTPLGVVRIDDPVSSVTVTMSQLRGDGVGLNIGIDKGHPTPTTNTTWGRVKLLYH